MKASFILCAIFAALLGTSCHTCPAENDPNFMECYPLCVQDRKEKESNVQEKWETFKSVRIYVAEPTAYPEIDNIANMVAKLSYQCKEEIVVPYITLDQEGLIAYYMEFASSVKHVVEVQKCSQEKAVELVFQQWQQLPGGKEKIAKLMTAFPILARLEQQKNILVVAAKIAPELINLLCNIRGLKNNVKAMIEDLKWGLQGDLNALARFLQASSVTAYCISNLNTMITALSFLNTYNGDLRAQRKFIEAHCKRLEAISRIDND